MSQSIAYSLQNFTCNTNQDVYGKKFKENIDDNYVKIPTVKQAVESEGKQNWKPDVGKSLKGEKHPLARAVTVES